MTDISACGCLLHFIQQGRYALLKCMLGGTGYERRIEKNILYGSKLGSCVQCVKEQRSFNIFTIFFCTACAALAVENFIYLFLEISGLLFIYFIGTSI